MHNISTQMSMHVHPSISSGAILHTSLSEDQSNQYAAIISSLSQKASILISTLDPDDDGNGDGDGDGVGGDELNFIRIRSKKKEIMVAPDKEFLMMVIQNPSIAEGIGISLE